jgi:hypothetical protein
MQSAHRVSRSSSKIRFAGVCWDMKLARPTHSYCTGMTATSVAIDWRRYAEIVGNKKPAQLVKSCAGVQDQCEGMKIMRRWK